MAQDRSTPEKRLLELIESPSDRTIREIKQKRKRNSFFSIGVLKGKFSFLRQRAGDNLARRSNIGWDIRQVNAILLVCAVGLIVYLVMSWLSASEKLGEAASFKIEVKKDNQAQSYLPSSFLRDISYYSQKVSARDIFKPDLSADVLNEEESGREIEEIITDEDELMEIIGRLLLVGVSWSDNPVAMIEDTGAKMTYFLKKGEEIKDGVKIKEIFIDKVILEYKTVEAEVKL